MRARGWLAVAMLLLPMATACASNRPRVPEAQLRIATGGRGGVYFAYGQALATVVQERVPQLEPTVLTTAASAENIRRVTEGAAEVGFTQADTAAEAHTGGSPLRALARLYDDYLHLVVRRDGPINSLDHLCGKRVSLGQEGSGTAITVRRLFAVAKLAPTCARATPGLGLDDSAAALRAGDLDAFFFSGGLPVSAVQQLAKDVPIRLVDLGDHAAALRQAHGPYYTQHVVPASTYGLPARAITIGIPNYLVVADRMPEATGYALTRAMFEGRATLANAHPAADRLNAREAINTLPLPLHPGAARWYRETKP